MHLMLERDQWVTLEGSDFAGDELEAPSGVMVAGLSYESAFAGAAGMVTVRALLHASGTSPRSYGPSLRASLIPATRTLWMLWPEDRSERVRRATLVRVMELSAYRKSLGNLSYYDHAKGPDRKVLAEQLLGEEQRLRMHMPDGKTPSDTAIVEQVADLVVDAMSKNSDKAHLMGLTIRRMWTVYSGEAHGWSWQAGLLAPKAEKHPLDGGKRHLLIRETDPIVVLSDALVCSRLVDEALRLWRRRAGYAVPETGI